MKALKYSLYFLSNYKLNKYILLHFVLDRAVLRYSDTLGSDKLSRASILIIIYLSIRVISCEKAY